MAIGGSSGQEASLAKALEFTGDNWVKEVVHSDQPVLVDFWGPG